MYYKMYSEIILKLKYQLYPKIYCITAMLRGSGDSFVAAIRYSCPSAVYPT